MFIRLTGYFEVVGRRGFEPRTNCLKGNCSTIELAPRFGASRLNEKWREECLFPHRNARTFLKKKKSVPERERFFRYEQKARINICAVSTRRNIVSG